MAWTRRSWIRVAAMTVGALLVAAACAKGSDLGEGGGEGGTTSSGVGGQAGGTGTGVTGGGGAGGGTGGGTSAGTASGTTTTETCSEDPCKLVNPQCGCGVNEKCTWSTGTNENSCVADGTVDAGGECANNCMAGSLCLNVGSLSMCKTFCEDDSDCDAPGGRCVLQILDPNDQPYPPTWCSDNCDLTASVGCSPVGSKCDVWLGPADAWFTICVPAGPGTQNSPCTDYSDCDSGYGCFGPAPLRCLQWCNLDTMSCPTCGPIEPPIIIGSVQYGACG